VLRVFSVFVMLGNLWRTDLFSGWYFQARKVCHDTLQQWGNITVCLGNKCVVDQRWVGLILQMILNMFWLSNIFQSTVHNISAGWKFSARLLFCICFLTVNNCLQCFSGVRWDYLCMVWPMPLPSRNPVISSSLKCRMVLGFWYWLTQVTLPAVKQMFV